MSLYDYSFTTTRKKRRESKKVLYIITFLFIAFTIIILNSFLKPKNNNSPINPINETNANQKVNTEIQNEEELLSKIQEYISAKPGTYSVYISDFKNNKKYGVNENTIFTAASVNKIPTLAALYYLADKGEIDLDETITLQKKDIQAYGTGTIQYDKPGTVYSLKTLARLLIEKSDNTANYILTSQIIGVKKIQELIKGWGLNQTDIDLNKTSNTDQEKLFKMIYEGEVANQALTSEMLDFMDDSDFEDRLPALLPKEVNIYHKIGNEIRNTHDVGIIDLPNKPYYLGVFINDNPNNEDSIIIISQISKMVFDFYTNRL